MSSSSFRPACASWSDLGFVADVVDHRVHGDAADQLALRVDHRRRDQVVAFESLRRHVGLVVRFEGQGFGQHHHRDLRLRRIDQQHVQGQYAAQVFVAIDDEELVGMVGQFVEAAQVAQHHLQRHVLAHGDHLEVHQRADRVFRVGHGGAQFLAFLGRQRAEHVGQHALGQVGGEVGQFVGIELFGCRHQFGGRHVLDERFAYRIGNFEQDFAVALGLDQVPDQQALVERQRFEDVGDVGRVHGVEWLRRSATAPAGAPGSRPVRGAACPAGAPGFPRASAARAIPALRAGCPARRPGGAARRVRAGCRLAGSWRFPERPAIVAAEHSRETAGWAAGDIERSEQIPFPAPGRGMGVGGLDDFADSHDRGVADAS
jgi:hypothetical protein